MEDGWLMTTTTTAATTTGNEDDVKGEEGNRGAGQEGGEALNPEMIDVDDADELWMKFALFLFS